MIAEPVVVVCNFQPVTRENYRVGVPVYGVYKEVFNSEAEEWGGTGIGNPGCLVISLILTFIKFFASFIKKYGIVYIRELLYILVTLL